MKFTHSAVEPIPFYPWVCAHHTFAVRNLILRCLTGSHMTILSKSNYRVRLNVNMDIVDPISFYFNFGKGYHFVLRLKQHFFDKARFFFNDQSKSCDSWPKRETGRNLRSPFAIIWKLSRQNEIRKITSFLLTPRLYKTLQTTGQKKYLEKYEHYDMLFERWTGARVFRRWRPKSMFYRNVILIINWS